jgi:hypothetical protein
MMRNFWLLYLAIAAMTSAVGQSSKVPTPAAPALRLTVRTDRQTYRMSDKIKMEAQLLNSGEEDVYIWDRDLCWNPARGLSLYVTTPDGAAVQGKVLFDCVPPPPTEGRVYAFIKLEPGRFYGIADEINVSDVVNKPGEYNFDVTYNSFLSRSFIKELLSNDPIAKLPVWTMEQQTIKALRLHIVVQPRQVKTLPARPL